MNCYRHIPFFFLLILAVFAIYGNTLNSPFLFDDYGNIVYNEHIRIEKLSGKSLLQVWNARHLSQNRKIPNLSFSLNYLYSGYDVRAYHIVNIIIHICCGLLAAVFFSQTISQSRLKTQYGYLSAWAAALIWAVHPIQINAVTYIVQRMTSLALMFSLLSMIAWMSGRKQWHENSHTQATVWWIFAFIAWIFALLSKENMAIVPFLILAHEFLLLKPEPVKIKGRNLLIFGVAILGIAWFYSESASWKQILAGYERRDFTMTERLMTQSRVLWHYVSLFYIPIAEKFSILYEYPVSRRLFLPISTIISILSWIIVMFSAWLYRKKYAVWTWMVAWYLIAHLIESSVIPLENIFEHRMYLPSIGLCFASVLIAQDIFSRYFNNFVFQRIVFVCIILIMGVATYGRNADFKDEVTLYRAELKKYPDSERIRLNLALALNRAGYFAEGSTRLEQMVREYPDDIVILQNWYNFLMRVKHDAQTAEPIYNHIVELIKQAKYSPSKDGLALQNMADFLFETGEYEKTLFFVEKLLETYYNYNSLWLIKGICHAKSEQWHSAVQALYQAWKESPDDSGILYWYAQSLIQTGKHDQGCEHLQKAAQSKTDKVSADLSQKAFSEYCVRQAVSPKAAF